MGLMWSQLDSTAKKKKAIPKEVGTSEDITEGDFLSLE